MENDNTFAKGLFIKMPNEKAPDFILLEMSIKPHDLFKWAQEFVTEESKGWVNVQIKRSKDGSKIYAQLNNWKPKPKGENTEINNATMQKIAGRDMTPEEELAMSNMEF